MEEFHPGRLGSKPWETGWPGDEPDEPPAAPPDPPSSVDRSACDTREAQEAGEEHDPDDACRAHDVGDEAYEVGQVCDDRDRSRLWATEGALWPTDPPVCKGSGWP